MATFDMQYGTFRLMPFKPVAKAVEARFDSGILGWDAYGHKLMVSQNDPFQWERTMPIAAAMCELHNYCAAYGFWGEAPRDVQDNGGGPVGGMT